ncbi:hypothetical protein DFJ63DRAFT_336165 [Scheffersomyces coipomensis]|uniref:uncharacterized protein n=1 Tax=Scheffersomyces coipomensis TaxID=1788519 RepID=UPI00315DC74C
MTDSSLLKDRSFTSHDENENIHYFYGTSSKTPVFTSSSSSAAAKINQSIPMKRMKPKSSIEFYKGSTIDTLKKLNAQSYENLPLSTLKPIKPAILARQRLVSSSVIQNAIFRREPSNYTSTTEDLFFEASPVLPISPSLDNPLIQNNKIIDDNTSEVKYFPSLLTESYPQIVEVDHKPHMSEPLSNSKDKLSLASIKSTSDGTINAFPFCDPCYTNEQLNEVKLMNILKEEIDLLDINVQKSPVFEYIKKLLFYKQLNQDSAWNIIGDKESEDEQESLFDYDSDDDIEQVRCLLYG